MQWLTKEKPLAFFMLSREICLSQARHKNKMLNVEKVEIEHFTI